MPLAGQEYLRWSEPLRVPAFPHSIKCRGSFLDRLLPSRSVAHGRWDHSARAHPALLPRRVESNHRSRQLPSIQSIASSARARRCLRIADGLNTITLRGVIGTSFPVFGFRPIRGPLLRTTKEPNEDSFTISPSSRRSVISLNTSSTNAADSDRDKWTFL